MREYERGSHQKRNGDSPWAGRAHTSSSQLPARMGEVKAHGQKFVRPKDENSEAPEGDMTWGAGEAWTVKLLHAEKVELSGSGSQAEGRRVSG